MFDYSKILRWMLSYAGGSITVKRKNGSSEKVKAVFIPLLYKNKLYVELQPSQVGKADDGMYRYLGPPNVEFAVDDILVAYGERFVVERFEKIHFADKAMYCWAVARPVTGGTEEQ